MRLGLSALFLTAGLIAVNPAKSKDKNAVDPTATLRKVVNQKWNLKPRYTVGQKRYYRLWQTIESLDQSGYVRSRSQWRGDFQREVKSVEPNGKAYEQITWKSVGLRSWNNETARFDQAIPVPWAEGFSYLFSAEEGYAEFDQRIDYSALPKSMFGFAFRGALQVTAHVEFDYLRSSRHATIERLQLPGQLLQDVPEDGIVFPLDYPSVVTNSALERKHVQVGFLGLTVLNREPCGVLDYRQGPQDFSWNIITGQAADSTPTGMVPGGLKSWHYGVFFVRLSDGSLIQAELTEHHVQRNPLLRTPGAGPQYSLGIWTIREITEEDFEEGLASWSREQMPRVEMLSPGPAAASSKAGDSFVGLASREYDLRPKPSPKAKNFYRLTTTIYFHDKLGDLLGRRQWRGDFERRQDPKSIGGPVRDLITWKNVGYRVADGGFDVPFLPHTAPEWAQGFSYSFSPELGYEDFPWDHYSGIPKTLIGYQFKLHTVNAHFEFDFLRSSEHGALEKIRRVGDHVRVPDNGRVFSIDHPPVVVNSRFHRENVITTFLGFSQVNGEPCAVLEFRQGPQKFSWDRLTEPQKTEHTELTSRQYGLLFVRLTDGSLLRGDFSERGILRTKPQGGEEQPGYFVAIFELEKITLDEFRRGQGSWDQEQPKHPAGRVYDR